MTELPPYGLSFMGKDWDTFIGDARVAGTSHNHEVFAKPGPSNACVCSSLVATLLAFGATRMFGRLQCAVEDAGFENRDTIAWIYGSGFPKGQEVGKRSRKVAG